MEHVSITVTCECCHQQHDLVLGYTMVSCLDSTVLHIGMQTSSSFDPLGLEDKYKVLWDLRFWASADYLISLHGTREQKV
jgi:hypothetical protein